MLHYAANETPISEQMNQIARSARTNASGFVTQLALISVELEITSID